MPRLLTSNQNRLMNLFFSAREFSLHYVPCILVARDPSSFRKNRLWSEICTFSGGTCLLEKPISGHWPQGKLNGTLITLTPSEKCPPLPLEVTSARTRGVCYGWSLKDWTWSDAQEELIICVHWRAGESSNAVLSSLLPMPRPIKYPCGIWETPMSDFPLLDGTWTCFSQRNVQTKLSKPLPDSETFKDVPICIK